MSDLDVTCPKPLPKSTRWVGAAAALAVAGLSTSLPLGGVDKHYGQLTRTEANKKRKATKARKEAKKARKRNRR